MQITIPSNLSHVGTYSSHSQLVFVEIYFQISLNLNVSTLRVAKITMIFILLLLNMDLAGCCL